MTRTAFEGELEVSPSLVVGQRRELAELVGLETRNKYEILRDSGRRLGFAAEQGKGALAFLVRQVLGHWRSFDLSFFDDARQLVMRARHPFRFLFQRLEVADADGRPLGAIQRRFALFAKRFDVENAAGEVVLTVASPLWKPWTFAFQRAGRDAAAVRKRWSGLLRESFTDADSFQVDFQPGPLSLDERKLVLAAAVYVDLVFFERKAG